MGRDVLLRVILLAGWWMVLSRGDIASWLVGVPIVTVATWVSVRLVPAVRWRWSLRGALQFGAFFARQSLLGGIDVAGRALHPGLPIRPGFASAPMRLPHGAARICLINVISLLPGTLAVDMEGDTLTLHTIDDRLPVVESVATLERYVAAMFALELETPA
jgi:multicomponent Na+:H+ antiporter subunit E